MYRIDLNSDLGELEGRDARLNDRKLMEFISSANVACGAHAGSPEIMRSTVLAAKETGTAIGAHPGFPDRENFGRTNMVMSTDEIKKLVKDQILALKEMAEAEGLKLQHVKPHGALYNMSAKDPAMARAIAEAIYETDKDLIFMGLSASEHIKAATEAGLRSVSEVFGDRAYMDDGSLVPRTMEGAVIHDPDLVIGRVLRMIKEGKVESINGNDIPISAGSVCVHGDTPEALEFLSEIAAALREEGIEVRCPGRQL